MPAMDLKLHRIHIEVAHFIHEKKGKLVPLSDIRAKFSDEHRVNEALWVLIEQRVVIEDVQYRGNYQLSREGAAAIEEQHAKLQEQLKAGKKVPLVPTEDSDDARREAARLKQAESAKADAEQAKPPVKKLVAPSQIKPTE